MPLAGYGQTFYLLLRIRKIFNLPLVDILPWKYIGKLLVGTGVATAVGLTILRPQISFGVLGLIGVAAVVTAVFALWARWFGLVGSDEVELAKMVFGRWT